jgi:BirA family biotin operon repressor/biotin-[acetyl-CoA-carboxylase] ligase
MKPSGSSAITPSPRPFHLPHVRGNPKGRGRNASAFNLAKLKTILRPFRLLWFTRLGSTNSHAAKLRRARKLFAPAIVLTANQISGRGRGSNQWWSAPGSLSATFVLPIREHLQPHQVPLLAGLAVRDAAARVSGADEIQLKWPNDVVYRDRKLAGLLCERIDGVDLIGVGINVNLAARDVPTPLRSRVTSMMMIAGQKIDLNDLLEQVASNLHRIMSLRDEPPFAQLLREYAQHHALTGRRVSIAYHHEPPISGLCEGVDREGRLLVRTRKNLERIIAGHVVLS